MHAAIALPPAYHARPVTPDDADRVAGLLNAAAIADTGKATTQSPEVLSDWQQPQLTLSTDTILVLHDAAAPDEPAPAAFAIFWDDPPHVQTFLDANVHPEHRGRGLGAALLGWGEARARAAVEQAPEGARVIVREFILSSNTAAQELLESRGWQRVRYNLRMAIELTERPADPPLPEGVRIRAFVRGQDDEHFAMTSEEAFEDHWGYVRIPIAEALAQWRTYMDTSPNFDSDLFLLAVSNAAGENPIVGVCCGTPRPAEGPEQGWVHNLAVLRPWRRQGIAHALLIRCFQALYDRGLWKIGLGVDAGSLTGATRLYEKAGMHVERRHEFWELELRAGV